ncbi:hypothetical protein [Streptomyces sp. RKAG293]|uniref:hypothetical protein n=1 Tax=Streptomyces sp. RKAG293 TaxID=2893403 RepID=UPI0020349FD0|nr:hypothetical protein [Streptomyces sp. RKAG293]MCM2417675.1 hypothetical protein [Streptomyces sp. RKAG293]
MMQEVLIEDVANQLGLLYSLATDLRAAYYDYADTVRGSIALAADGTDGQLHDIYQQIGQLEHAIGAVIFELARLKQQEPQQEEREWG